MLALLVLQTAAATPAIEAPRFEKPVRVLADGAPLNEVERMLFPSPTVFDVDRDGAAELVVGDLTGRIFVYERAEEGGGVAWGEPRSLAANGETLKLPNW